MRLDSLFPFIVPLTFLAIWALTSLLNRDAQPLPPRPGRSGPPRPPRPMSGPAAARAQPAREWGGPQSRPLERQRPAPLSGLSRGASGDEGIVILGPSNESRRGGRGDLAPPPPRPPRAAKAQRGGKGRGAAGSRSQTPEQSTPRALSAMVNESMAETRNRPLEITPLASPLTPLMVPLSGASSALAAEKAVDRPVGVPVEHIRLALSAPDRLRELALLSEILKPPLSLRSLRRSR